MKESKCSANDDFIEYSMFTGNSNAQNIFDFPQLVKCQKFGILSGKYEHL